MSAKPFTKIGTNVGQPANDKMTAKIGPNACTGGTHRKLQEWKTVAGLINMA